MVVGLLVVGNIIILVRGPSSGAAAGRGQTLGWVPGLSAALLQSLIPASWGVCMWEGPSYLTLQRGQSVLCECSLSVTESSVWIL